MRNLRRSAAACAAALLVLACGDRAPMAYGDPNSVIVIAPDSIWAQVSEELKTTLAPTIFAVRDEETFQISHVSPNDPNWRKLREWRQVLAIGEADDPWVEPIADDAGGEAADGIVQATGVWAGSQTATAIVLPEGAGADFVRGRLPELHALLDRQFRDLARRRMYASGVDTALADTLRAQAGFSLLLPDVYRRQQQDRVYRFVNSQPKGGSEIIRSIAVTWREGTPEALTAERVTEWRAALARELYDPAQEIEERIESRVLEGMPGPAIEVQGTWSALGNWPMAGPFVDRIVVCPNQNRTYFLDAYLFAPGEDKYEYMLQLQTILDTFECGGSA